MKQLVLSAILVFGGLSSVGQDSAPAGQVQKPNLSGTWKANVDKSNLAPGAKAIFENRLSRWMIFIDHREPKITTKFTVPMGESDSATRDVTDTSSFTTDGAETIVNKKEGLVKTAKWEGSTLVIRTLKQGKPIKEERLTLWADGKTLRTDHRFIGEAGGFSFDISVVMDKVEP